jgi:6-pyruvoyltetrahydropterin/6-carboxytetrahydropterin synthase
MFEIEKSFRFEAGHTLVQHDGKCRHPHGHSYLVTLRLRRKELNTAWPKKNMVVDFQTIDAVMKPIIEASLDHAWLNDTLHTDSPTAEFIAMWIFEKVHPALPELVAVTVHETQTAQATYSL